MDALGHAARLGSGGHELSRILAHHLTHGDDPTAQRQLVVLGAALDLLPVTAPAVLKAELEQAAAVFERATRSRVTADLGSTRILRRSVQAIRRDPPQDRDGGWIRDARGRPVHSPMALAEAEAAGHNPTPSSIRHSANAPWTTPTAPPAH